MDTFLNHQRPTTVPVIASQVAESTNRPETIVNMDYMVRVEEVSRFKLAETVDPDAPELVAARAERMRLYGCLGYG